MQIFLNKYRYLAVFFAFAFLILVTKAVYFDYPLIWDETQLLKPDVAAGKFWEFIPPFNMPYETYGHPTGIALVQSIYTFVFGSSNIALRALSLLMSASTLTLMVFVLSLIGSFGAGVVAALMMMFSPLYFPSMISFLPQSYELIGGLLLLAVTYQSLDKRNPYQFANVSILGIFLRETNLAFWAPYAVIHLWKWIKSKKDFPFEALVAPFLVFLHFGFNKLKTGHFMPHPLLINNDFEPQMGFLEMQELFLTILQENSIFYLLLIFLIVSLILVRKQKEALLINLFPLALPLVLHLAFYNVYYRDFGHRDYIPTFCLFYLISVKTVSMYFEQLGIKKYIQVSAALMGILVLFATPSFHGHLLKSHYFRVQTSLYLKTVDKLKEMNISDRYLYAPWPLSHALLLPSLNWVKNRFTIVGNPEQAEYLILTDTTPDRRYLELAESSDWRLLDQFSQEDMYVKIMKRNR